MLKCTAVKTAKVIGPGWMARITEGTSPLYKPPVELKWSRRFHPAFLMLFVFRGLVLVGLGWWSCWTGDWSAGYFRPHGSCCGLLRPTVSGRGGGFRSLGKPPTNPGLSSWGLMPSLPHYPQGDGQWLSGLSLLCGFLPGELEIIPKLTSSAGCY